MKATQEKAFVQFLTDGSFDGYLTAIFEAFAQKVVPSNIIAETAYQPGHYGRIEFVRTDEQKAERVAKRLIAIDKAYFKKLYCVFLCEERGREMLLYHLIFKLLYTPDHVLKKPNDDKELQQAQQLIKEVAKEVVRMQQYVRFQQMENDTYFAPIAPDYDVLPLLGPHFERHMPNRQWVIYDVQRGYGLHFDTRSLSFVEMQLPKNISATALEKAMERAAEGVYQEIWKDYFKAVNIELQHHMKLHVRRVPRRYWGYLLA
jgi:probable DNA metabolism protein